MTTSSITPARTSAALLVLAGILWGTGGLAGTVLSSAAGLHPVSVAACRLLVGGLCAAAVVTGTGGLRFLRAHPGRLLVTGVLLAEFPAAYQVAVAQISVSLATLVTIGCVPVCVAGVTALRVRRLPNNRTLAAVAGSLVGLALLTGAPAGFAVLTLITARPVPGQDAITSVGLLVGDIFLAPFALAYGMAVPLTGEVLALVAYLGVVPTAVAYGAYFLGLRHAGATAAALAPMLEPLTATLLSVAFHGERLTAVGVGGAVLIACALALHYVSSRGGPRR